MATAALAVLCLAAAGAAQRAPARAPDAAPAVDAHLATTGRQLSVQLRVNGEGPYLFTLDTGSGMTVCIDEELARMLELPTVGEVLNSDSSDRVVPRPLVQIDALEFGGHDFGAQRALVADYRFVSGEGENRVMGILGLPLFARGVVTLDAPGERLTWAPEAALPDGPHVAPYVLPGGIPEVDVTLGGHALRALVDTGFVGDMAVPHSLRGELEELSEPRVVGTTRGPNGGPGAQVVEVRLDATLELAGHALQAPKVWFLEGRETPYLGGALLRRYVLAFDLDARRLALTTPGDAPPADADD